MPAPKDLIGQVFGRLTVIAQAGRNGHAQRLWECRCKWATRSEQAFNRRPKKKVA
jgi:hypothetical protein